MSIDWQAFQPHIELGDGRVGLSFLVAASRSLYWIAFSRWRWKFPVEALVALPMSAPNRARFYVLVALGSKVHWDAGGNL